MATRTMMDTDTGERQTIGRPKKEALSFPIDREGLTPEMYDVMVNIKWLFEQNLSHWTDFPLIPPAFTSSHDDENQVSYKDLFMAPVFDELDEVAVDKTGKARSLDHKQLADVRKYGEFSVESVHFPGQYHKWRLSQLLQKGTQRAHISLLNDMAWALRLLIVTAKNRIYSHFFSLSQTVRWIGKAFWLLLDLLIGMPSTTLGDLAYKIRDEHTKHLIAELDVKGGTKREWRAFCDYIQEKCQNSPGEREDTLHPPVVPHLYTTAKSLDIDLRLFNKDLMLKCVRILKGILDQESRGWHLKYKDKLITELKDQNLSNKKLTEVVNRKIGEEYLRRVFSAILENPELELVQSGIGKLLVEHAKTVIIMRQALENIRLQLFQHKKQLQEHLEKDFPVRSRIPAWMHQQQQEFEKEFIRQHMWSAHEEALAKCRHAQLHQSVYFLQRDLDFMKEREGILRKELSKVKLPNREFKFRRMIWRPWRWEVTRYCRGETERIITVVCDKPAPPTNLQRQDTCTYNLSKHWHSSTSSRWPFWRWLNYAHRTLSWASDAMFILLVVVPWCSPVGIRALFSLDPFYPDLELNPRDGSLCPRLSSKTQTLVSRLRSLWQHVRQSRTTFEATPDTGFLGKSLTRQFNRVWNYFFKGALGTVGLVLFMPPLCILVSLLSLLAGVTSPIWVPIITTLIHLTACLVYDFDHPDSGGNKWFKLFDAVIWRLLILGCLQPIAAVIAAFIVLPLTSFTIVLVGVLRRGCRAFWDTIMFHLVIKKRARVPASDSFIARRIAGPGLASNYFYQIKPEQALAAFESCLELHELKAWRDATLKLIEQPLTEYSDFVTKVFQPFSASLSSHGIFESLKKETHNLTQALKHKMDERKRMLHTGLNSELKSKIKLTGRELKVTIALCSKLIESFYPEHVLSRHLKSQEQFWEENDLEPYDWQGLTKQILSDVFSPSFLTPLEDTDTCFKLQVEHLDLKRYLKMLTAGEFRDDLDIVNAVHTPKGDIDVDAPFLELSAFNPTKQLVEYTGYLTDRGVRRKWPWKKMLPTYEDLEKMEVPPPIANPAHIAVAIYNRIYYKQPIDVGDPVCQLIIKAAESVPYNTHSDLTDIEPSTPDDHTTVSDPDVMTSHIAQAEHSMFSDNDESIRQTPDSEIPDDVIMHAPQQLKEIHNIVENIETLVDNLSENNSEVSQSGVVLYSEGERDTACVLHIRESSEETEDVDTQSASEEEEMITPSEGSTEYTHLPTNTSTV
ncbi:unnamed protein product [Owenia fusiformis]|uniref:Uncharacterized protein n=1 Tax=Owenia fusiformis TaxID=6347 RepID=A0A8J1Y703_OWEFU|nr:unnamed protein product [Owenia fusiformis]